jgi:hypothetical protein
MSGWCFWRCILLPMHCRRSLPRSLGWICRCECRGLCQALEDRPRGPEGLVRYARSRRGGCTSLRLRRRRVRGRLWRGETSLRLLRALRHWRNVSTLLQRRNCSIAHLGEAIMVMIRTAANAAIARSFFSMYGQQFQRNVLLVLQTCRLSTPYVLQHGVDLRKQWSTVCISKQKVGMSMSISCAISADRILADRRLRPFCVAAGGGTTILIPPIKSVSVRSVFGVIFV